MASHAARRYNNSARPREGGTPGVMHWIPACAGRSGVCRKVAMNKPEIVHSETHDIFRASVRRFIEREVKPHHAQWEKDGKVSREVWRKAGEAGLLLTNI